jgi:hypothetical protein
VSLIVTRSSRFGALYELGFGRVGEVRWIVHVHLLHLTHGMCDEVDLDVVEPDPIVLVGRADEAAVIGLVADLDHRPSLLMLTLSR